LATLSHDCNHWCEGGYGGDRSGKRAEEAPAGDAGQSVPSGRDPTPGGQSTGLGMRPRRARRRVRLWPATGPSRGRQPARALAGGHGDYPEDAPAQDGGPPPLAQADVSEPGEKPQTHRCSSQFRGPFPSISASLSPFGCRPSRIASTMSGAKHVSGSNRQTYASVTPSCSARSAIDFARPLSIWRRQR
jgi:hypothetical protein